MCSSTIDMTSPTRSFHEETQTVNIQRCEVCETELDFSGLEPLSQVKCPNCEGLITVRGRLGVYKIVEIAGRGGMGIVYKGFDPSLNRYVALKLLRKDRSKDEKLMRELANEAVLSASVSHPNVGRVFATGSDHNRFYIVMELVEKGSLEDLMRLHGKVAELQALQVGIQVASGLRAANEIGLIHRDIKPGNI